MSEHKEGRPTFTRRASRRGMMSPLMAAAILVVAVGILAAVNYVVLNELGTEHTTTTTAKSCSPSTSPQCKDAGQAADARYPTGVVAASAL